MHDLWVFDTHKKQGFRHSQAAEKTRVFDTHKQLKKNKGFRQSQTAEKKQGFSQLKKQIFREAGVKKFLTLLRAPPLPKNKGFGYLDPVAF